MIVKRLNKDFSLLDDTLIAHKGIYGYSNKLKRKVEPNTYESCKIAIDNNIPFECDIRNTLDNVPVLAHDNRLSAPVIKENLLRGLIDSGITVYDLGLASTLALRFSIK